MQTANRAGMFAVGALWGFRDAEELKKNGAKRFAASPLDILDLLPPSLPASNAACKRSN